MRAGTKGERIPLPALQFFREENMKIIAKSRNRFFLAEISAQEIDFLAGKEIGKRVDSGYSHNVDRDIQPGTTFNIIPAFTQIHRNGQRKAQVESLRQTLNAMLIGLDMAEPLIEEPPPEYEPVDNKEQP